MHRVTSKLIIILISSGVWRPHSHFRRFVTTYVHWLCGERGVEDVAAWGYHPYRPTRSYLEGKLTVCGCTQHYLDLRHAQPSPTHSCHLNERALLGASA
jgi:hypothetical protein